LATDQLDALPQEIIRFVNPGDHRVAHVGCGSGNPQEAGTGCHQDVVEASRLSVMETFTGHYNLSRFLAGMQTRTAEVGVVERVSPITADEPNDPLRTENIRVLRGATVDPDEDFVASAMDTYLVQKCPYCHTASFGRNNDNRNYRSSGCTACHMLYGEDGLSHSNNPHVDPNEPGHPLRHELTTRIPTSQCEHCHFQGARIGLTYQGIREGMFNEPQNARDGHVVWKPQGVHGNRDDAYYEKENDDPRDTKTPPDIHCRAPGEPGDECKMDCADCHTTQAVHGDGKMYSTAKGQVDIQCTDCHGTVRQAVEPDSNGVFRTSNGTPLKQLERVGDRLTLVTKRTGERLEVTQIADSVAEKCNPDNRRFYRSFCDSMAPNERSFSHTDSMECWACHTSWRMNCFGCHISYTDTALNSRFRNEQTGEYMSTQVGAYRQFFDIEMTVLGINQRGMIDTLCPSMQFFFTRWRQRETEDGRLRPEKVIDQEARIAGDGRVGFGWMPNNQHTVNLMGKPCADCHPKSDGSNRAKVAETFGYGNPNKQYWVASRTGEPRRPGGYKCRSSSDCPEDMDCLNPCPDNTRCDSPETPTGSGRNDRRCATICRSNDDCERAAVCVRRIDPTQLRGPVEVLTSPSIDSETTGLCVYDLTQMLLPDGRPISPPAHEGTGPVPRAQYERAQSVELP